jgi:Cu(I)/Ag(I) efflux system membrane fusion protein
VKALLKFKEMKTKALSYLIMVMFLTIIFTSCKQKPQPVLSQGQSKAYYTCSMHPQVHLDQPGTCPICGMKLIKVELTGASAGTNSGKITLTASQITLGGIETDTVREENTGNEKTVTGTVTTNENHAEQLSSTIVGRIQRLFVRAIGEKISMGQPVYTIYSEDVLEAEKEYLLARQQQKMLSNPDIDFKQLVGAAENKLLLWGITHSQIASLAASGQASATVAILSKVSGTVSDIAVHEGDYVSEGMAILKTQGLNSLWVEAQIYAGETGTYRENDPVIVSFPDLGGQVIRGKIEFINPELSDASKVDLIRVSIANPLGLIRPGMQAYIAVSKGKQRALAVPASAILTSSKGDMVWIKNADGSFSPRMITSGSGNANYVPVLSGLKAGEVIVTGGAYLLNSESIFKNGDKAMGDMKM